MATKHSAHATVTPVASDLVLGLQSGTANKNYTAANVAALYTGTKGADLASAATVTLANATGNTVHITGTTTITSFGNASAGLEREVIFDGILTLTHNATSLILPTGASLTTAAGDSARFVCDTTNNWRCIKYNRASGQPLVGATPANDSVTNAILADMAQSTIKGRATASTGDPEDLTGAQVAVITQGTGLDVDAAGFRGVPQNSQSGNYTCVAADAGKHLIHPSGAGAGDAFTIPANSSVAFEVGTAITFVNMDSSALSIAITTDTMRLAGAGTSGTRSLAQYGVATALKVGTTEWLISGTNLT